MQQKENTGYAIRYVRSTTPSVGEWVNEPSFKNINEMNNGLLVINNSLG
jgi:hypothetical protein